MFEGKASRPKWWSRPGGAGAPGAGFRADLGGARPVDQRSGGAEETGPAPGTAPPRAASSGTAAEVRAGRRSPETVRLAPVRPPSAPPSTQGEARSGPPGSADGPRAERVSLLKKGPAVAPGDEADTGQAMGDADGPGGIGGPGGAGGEAAPGRAVTGGRPGVGRPPAEQSREQHAAAASGARHTTVPRFRPDPYGTPPYGEPGPYAPAPPVQHPGQAFSQTAAQPQHHAPWHRPAPWNAVPPPPPPRRRGRLLVGAVLIALCAGLVGGVTGAAVDGSGSEVAFPQAPSEQEPPTPDSVAGIAEATLPGVVYIHVKGDGGEATGTGFVLDSRGHVLTNNHVIQPARDGGAISVTLNSGEVRRAELMGGDSGYDLAVLKLGDLSGLHPLRLGNSDSVRVGDPVVAIGAPFDLEGTVTSGIISAKDRPITTGGRGGSSDVSFVNALQTDAPINPGNSGGPLVNSRGEVIGVNTAIRSAGGGPEVQPGGSIGLGFAIPINQSKRVAEELINTGKATHPVIGVQVDLRFSGDGAKILEASEETPQPVTPGGPADKAGIEPGDVITAVDGKAVRSGEELIVKIRSRRPGDAMLLTVSRDGRERQVEVVLGSASSG